MIGTKLGPYEISAKLGEGGMGEVYRATDTKLEREVAIKVLPTSFTENPERLARFKREAQILAKLHHPNIASIFGLEESEGVRALVMEWVDGQTLADRLKAGPLPLDECLPIALQISEALEEAHEKGVVHRDLKPQNIQLTAQGKVKVLDFGLAKALDPAGSGATSPDELTHSPTATYVGTRHGVILGTAPYMAPEQARGTAVDKRADIWAFGVVLYETLTGERLFAEGSVADTLSAVMRKPIDLDRLPDSTPRRLSELVRRCLQRDPSVRLRDIGEARIVLQPLVSGVEDLTSATRISPAPRRWSAGLGIGVAAVSLMLGALLAIWIERRSEQVPAAEPIRVHPLTYSGADSEPAASPDGKLIAFTSWRDGTPRIWLKQTQGGGEAPITEGPDRLARFSPDGASLLFVRGAGIDQSVFRMALVGGEPRRLVDDATLADWSPDGRQIVFVRSHRAGTHQYQIGILDLASGEEKIVASEANRILHSPRWSPNSRRIAFSSGGFSAPDWQLRELDIESGRVRDLCPSPNGYQLGGLAWSGTGESLFFVQSPTLLGDVVGSGSRILRCDPDSGSRRTLFWSDGLVWTTSSVSEVTLTDILQPGRLIFSQRLRRQSLREIQTGPGASPSASRQLSNASSIDRQPVYSNDDQRILFSSNRGGNLDIWQIDRATGALFQITDDPAEDWDPVLTPDGQTLLWCSNRGGRSFEVWAASADGSGARQISRDGVSAQNPAATPDGEWIVYWSGNPEKLGVWKIRPDGSEPTLLKRANATLTDLSWDGRDVLYLEQDRLSLRNELRFVEVESGRDVPFKIDVPYRLGAPAISWGRARWSRDGRQIYFIGENEEGLSGVYVQDYRPGLDTSSTRRPVAGFSRDYVTESFDVSSDGSAVVLSAAQESAAIVVAEGVPGARPQLRREGAGPTG